jgi:hypothetical protein
MVGKSDSGCRAGIETGTKVLLKQKEHKIYKPILFYILEREENLRTSKCF